LAEYFQGAFGQKGNTKR